MSKFKVLLADDHALFRAGLRSLMELENDIQVVGEAENGRLAVELAKTLRPEIVVMDIAMPILNGLEATRQILHEMPETKILILSGYSNGNYIDEVIDAGACGYLIKQSSPGAMLKAIRDIRKGNKIYSPSISNHVRKNEDLPLETLIEVHLLEEYGSIEGETATLLFHKRIREERILATTDDLKKQLTIDRNQVDELIF